MRMIPISLLMYANPMRGLPGSGYKQFYSVMTE